ncbi:c-type cytochrome [Chryseobacterium sp. SIMBA_038]|uniref:c-type cytochrome n=1 Tax=Chryseobacterium sp. SIMBA_038 TaxID=3085780 RepID=UPI00397B9483
MKKILYILSSAVLLIACESRTYEEISDNTPITETVRYTQDVKPVVEANCIGCHSATGSASYKPFTNYDQVKANIDGILNRIQRQNGDSQKMPQGGSLSQSQINIFIKWKADGLIEN